MYSAISAIFRTNATTRSTSSGSGIRGILRNSVTYSSATAAGFPVTNSVSFGTVLVKPIQLDLDFSKKDPPKCLNEKCKRRFDESNITDFNPYGYRKCRCIRTTVHDRKIQGLDVVPFVESTAASAKKRRQTNDAVGTPPRSRSRTIAPPAAPVIRRSNKRRSVEEAQGSSPRARSRITATAPAANTNPPPSVTLHQSPEVIATSAIRPTEARTVAVTTTVPAAPIPTTQALGIAQSTEPIRVWHLFNSEVTEPVVSSTVTDGGEDISGVADDIIPSSTPAPPRRRSRTRSHVSLVKVSVYCYLNKQILQFRTYKLTYFLTRTLSALLTVRAIGKCPKALVPDVFLVDSSKLPVVCFGR